MGSFWLWALVLALLAVGFVLWPLLSKGVLSQRAAGVKGSVTEERDQVVMDLYRVHLHDLETQRDAGEIDEEQFQQLQKENELALLEDTAVQAGSSHKTGGKWLLLGVALLVPALAIGMYWQRGSQADLEIQALRDQLMSMHVSSEMEMQEAQRLSQELRERLIERVESKPDNGQYWYSLARMSVGDGDYALAIKAYQNILRLEPGNPKILSEVAQAQFLQANNKITPVVSGLIAQALAQNPHEPTALGLAGIEAFEQAKYAEAITHWERAIAQLGPMSPGGEALRGGIQRAREMLGEAPAVEASAEQAGISDVAEVDQASLVVNVSLGDAAETSPDQVVYIYARAWQGPKMPLAITRIQVADLPAQVTLNDSMSMMAGMNLSSVSELELVARVSRDGRPIAQAGDWQASKGPLQLDRVADELTLVINSQVK